MLYAFLVFLGGGLGSLSRYLIALGMTRLGSTTGGSTTQAGTPASASVSGMSGMAGTLLVNIAGCLLIGLAWGRLGPTMREEARLLLVVGFLGGFTTFSAIGWEGFALLLRGQPAMAGVYILLTVALGLAAVWLGHTLGYALSPAAAAS
jgi:CrcB protein